MSVKYYSSGGPAEGEKTLLRWAIRSGNLKFMNHIMRPLLLLVLLSPIGVSLRSAKRPICFPFGMLTHSASLVLTALALGAGLDRQSDGDTLQKASGKGPFRSYF